MKSIVIVTDFDGTVSSTITKNLEEIFADTLDIKYVYLDSIDKDYIIEGDVVLFMLPNRMEQVINHLNRLDNIVIVSRTILEEDALKILSIKEGSNVLVVNDYYETTIQLTTLLYKLKVRNINFIPYEKDKEYEGINYAVTADMKEYVPSHIENVIDVGPRCLDANTILLILNKLNINDSKIHQRVLKYMEKIINMDEGINQNYKDLYRKNEQLKSILENTSEGIMLINSDNKIILYNNKCNEILNINQSIYGIDIVDILGNENSKLIYTQVLDKLVTIDNKQLLISTKINKLDKLNEEKILIIKDITYIKKLEQIVQQKLKSKGLIPKYNFDKIIHESDIMKECIKNANRFAKTDKRVLIFGESGTGKELIAQSIHMESSRSKCPFVAINCASFSESLLESELFGYEKGAFTGAKKEGRIGLFEQANNGTIFLDEIGDMPISLQTRLLRVIQEMQVMKVGGNEVIDIDVRIIAATNKNLLEEVKKGDFREDLYYRLNVLPIKVPSLRERENDILILFKYFIKEEKDLPKEIEQRLLKHKWNGNVRELQNVAEYYSIMKDSDTPLPSNLEYELVNKSYDADEIIINSLRIIERYAQYGIGRGKLLEELKNLDDIGNISEYKVRAILKSLLELGYIDISIGRKGITITKEGMKALINI